MFSRFYRLLQQELQSELPSAADVELSESAGLRTLAIRTSADLLYPRIPLNGFFEEYRRGRSVHEICLRILDIYAAETLRPFYTPGDLPERGVCLQGLGLRPACRAMHRKLMQILPHAVCHDLLFFYTLSLPEREEKLGASLLTDELRRHLGIQGESLFQRAVSNTTVAAPAVIAPLENVLEMLSGGLSGRDIPLEVARSTARDGVYVLTNESGNLGACTILYRGMPEALGERFGPYYLLPSSVHELLILPQKDAGSTFELQALIRSVNRSLCDSLLVLSDDLYAYDPEKGLRVFGTV